jgi:hypothetical protein
MKNVFLTLKKLKTQCPVQRWTLLFLPVSTLMVTRCLQELQIQQAWIALRHQNMRMLNQVPFLFIFCASVSIDKNFCVSFIRRCSIAFCMMNALDFSYSYMWRWCLLQYIITKPVPHFILFLRCKSLQWRELIQAHLFIMITWRFQVNWFWCFDLSRVIVPKVFTLYTRTYTIILVTLNRWLSRQIVSCSWDGRHLTCPSG